jgi:hypothetical protein
MTAPPLDSWDLRRDFLKLRTDEDFREFHLLDFEDLENYPGGRLPGLQHMISSMRVWQKLIRVLSVTPREKWSDSLCLKEGIDDYFKTEHGIGHRDRKLEIATAHSLRIFPPEKDGGPAEIVSFTVLGAMLDSIHAEKMQGYKTGYCAFEDCHECWIAKNGNERRRKYCEQHASIGSTRVWRENLRNGHKRRKRNRRKDTAHTRARAAAA